jgi:hypothetical protein
MQAFRLLAVTVLGVWAFGIPSAMAGGPIVLESYTETRPPDIERLIAPLLEELANRSYIGGYDAVGRTFEARQSRASGGQPGLPADFAAQVDLGHRAWIGGKFADAIKILSPLVMAAQASAGTFTNQSLRDPLEKAIIALALSYQRQGDLSAAAKLFDELLRSFPGSAVSRASYGPEAAKSFEDARKQAEAAGAGGLQVRASSATAAIFINEHLDGIAPVTKQKLLPGEYRVFAQLGQQLSRTHHVTVKANETARVTIDPGFDVAVQTTPRWTGLRFANAAEREQNEGKYAAKFANDIDAAAVVVVGVDKVAGHPAIVGALVDLTGRELRRASVTLDADPASDRLKALAAFLTGEKAASGIDVQISNDITAPVVAHHGEPSGPGTPEQPSTGGLWGGWKFVTGGAALVGLGVGGYLLVQDGKCTSTPPAGTNCFDFYDNTVPGWLTFGGGLALAGVTTYLVLRHDSPGGSQARTAYVMPTPGGAMAGVAARF